MRFPNISIRNMVAPLIIVELSMLQANRMAYGHRHVLIAFGHLLNAWMSIVRV